MLYPEISGLLKNITVREGQRVKKGDRMATLSDSGMIEQLPTAHPPNGIGQNHFRTARTAVESKNRF